MFFYIFLPLLYLVARPLHAQQQPQSGLLGDLLDGFSRSLSQSNGQQAAPQQQMSWNNQQQPQANLGQDVANFLGQVGQQISRTTIMENTGSSQFFEPSPDLPIPSHVQRRIMRFCFRHPHHPKCREHSRWHHFAPERQPPPSPGGDLNEIFPSFTPFRVPPIPQSNQLHDLLAGVPQLLRNVIPAPILGQLSEIGRQAIELTCGRNQCLTQKPEWLQQRTILAEHEAAVQRFIEPDRPQEHLDNEIETRLTRTYQIKQALIRNAGLSNTVEPANNGVFQHDVLLTEKQSNAILNEINNNNGSGRSKRSAIFLEENSTQHWPTNQSILYWFDQSLVDTERSAIEAAIQEIQAKSCLRFQRATKQPTKHYLYYVKISNPTFCGLSYIGKIEPANPIYLSFMCGNPTGIAIHETLHALGLNHEQLRNDRDDFINIQWENVNPQNYDFFSIANAKLFTSYGIKYDYGSIMHYSSTTASQFPNKITMTAKLDSSKNNVLMGQRYEMSQSDSQLLRKLYCTSPGCNDINVYCGVWALRSFCNATAQKEWMQQNCRKSCGFCN